MYISILSEQNQSDWDEHCLSISSDSRKSAFELGELFNELYHLGYDVLRYEAGIRIRLAKRDEDK